MASRKPSALKRQRDLREGRFSELGGAFAKEQARIENNHAEREAARRRKACTSKNRYSSRAEAEAVLADCASHGRTGLHIYKCQYCNGWHLTSKDYGND